MSWWELKAIADEQRQSMEDERRQLPSVCPNDGSLLDVRADGVRNCPMGDFTWGGPIVRSAPSRPPTLG